MWTPRGARPLIVAALGAGLFLVPCASAAVKAPAALLPASNVKVDRMPVFTWAPVKGVDHYEFQMAADKGFNSTVSNGKQATKNTAVTLPTSLINGTYYWRVRSVTAAKKTSPWTKSRIVALKWAPVMNLTGPADATAFVTPSSSPTDAVILRWAPMTGAAQYAVSISVDPLLSTLVNGGGQPELIDGTAYTLTGAIADGTYYWSVTPIDAEGHKGFPSVTRSVSVHWDSSAGAATVTDLAPDSELMDPLFSWGPVLGASKYEVEISTSTDFAGGSKIAGVTTTATSFSPTALLPNNTYFWRVRPYDASGNAGIWTVGTNLTKTFDSAPNSVPAIKNIRMRDMSDIGTDSSHTPVIMWDPVMGAAFYQIEIHPGTSLGENGALQASCSSSVWDTYQTAVPAWTPLGALGGTPPSIGNSSGVTTDGRLLEDGKSYCAQIRAIDVDRSGTVVYGDWTLANDFSSPLFQYNATPPPSAHAPCNGNATTGWLCAGDYVTPVNTTVTETPPVFVWKPIGAPSGSYAGYYIIVARDPSFSNIVDYAFTNETAYAPRRGGGGLTYADETAGSQLYWAVLPSAVTGGQTQPIAQLPTLGNKQVFNKQSLAPAIQPANLSGAGVSFQWAPILGAANYTLQVATDSSFSNILEEVTTDSASYSAARSYPPGQTLYYRVRGNDTMGNGLTWATGVFARSFPAPVPAAAAGDINPPKLDGVPNWSWSALQGATAYDVHVDYPNGTSKDVNGIHGTTVSWSKVDGPGVWKWKVRGEFGNGSTTGPWSPVQTFTRTFGEPSGRRSVVTKTRLILSWDPKQGAKTYHLQVSSDSDFSSTVDDVTQDAARFAPLLTSAGYTDGGRLLWRVAAIDAEGNQGDWSPVARISLSKGLKVAGDTSPAKGKAQSITVTVTNAKGAPVKDVTVRVAGAGTPPRAKKSNKKGKVVLKVRPTSVGTLTFRATKSGYQLGTLVYTIT